MSHEADSDAGNRSPEPARKRKRTIEQENELEIDLSLPEPPSKKAARKLRKSGGKAPTAVTNTEDATPSGSAAQPAESEAVNKPAARSEWGVWIGNMLWTTTKDALREFLIEKGEIKQDDITRVNMPAPAKKDASWKGAQPVNKGFAYVDFIDEEAMKKALALSETLLLGRKVLIKNAKSFEGRPEQKAGEATSTEAKKEPSKRVFIGNLPFDTTTDDIREHFTQAGNVEDVFLTTFEDSGKCKGYGWVIFETLEAAQAAVSGYIYKAQDDDSDEEGVKSKKPRKWYINRLNGRELRREYAEDAQTRYKKRFGKAKDDSHDAAITSEMPRTINNKPSKKLDADQRQALRRQKHEDARLVAPGKALARAQRASTAIVAGSGKKISFD